MKKSFSIYNALDKLRKRPGMYIGREALSNVAAWLFGYQMAMHDAGIKEDSQPDFQAFNEWIRKKFGYLEATAGWPNMILASVIGLNPSTISWEEFDRGVTESQQRESINLFFELLDEFRQSG